MAFSMENIKNYAKNNRKKFDAKPLFRYIDNLINVSNEVKMILKAYLRRSLNIRGYYGLTVEKFESMVVELLESCCNKNICDITPNDTDANYGEILYQLKYAIDKNYRFKIYHNEEISVEDLFFKPSEYKCKSAVELDDFFEGEIFNGS